MSETVTQQAVSPDAERESADQKPPATVWTYARPGSYLIGVPARDLTEEDYQALPPELQTAVNDSGLYTPARQAEPAKE